MATYLKGPLEHLLHQMQVTCLGVVGDGEQLPRWRMVLTAVSFNKAINLALHMSKEKRFVQQSSSAEFTD